MVVMLEDFFFETQHFGGHELGPAIGVGEGDGGGGVDVLRGGREGGRVSGGGTAAGTLLGKGGRKGGREGRREGYVPRKPAPQHHPNTS